MGGRRSTKRKAVVVVTRLQVDGEPEPGGEEPENENENQISPPPSKSRKGGGGGRNRRSESQSGGPSPSPPLPPRKVKVEQDKDKERPKLGLKLFRRRDEDLLSDMAFILPRPDKGKDEGDVVLLDENGDIVNVETPDALRVKGHMLIVREGSKTLEEMIKRRVRNGRIPPEIKVPNNGVDGTVFQEFLKFLYTEDLAPIGHLGEETMSCLFMLADHFDVDALYERCEMMLKGMMKPKDCPKVLEMSLGLRKNELWELAEQLFLRHSNHLLDGEDCVDWSWKVWRCILPKLKGDHLVRAFKALKRWRDHDPPKRDELFHRLGKCVRFRSFGSAAAADTLEGTGILSQTDMVALFVHFAGGQKTISVTPKENLQKVLDSVPQDSRLRLLPGVYEGDFRISKRGIKLIGEGPDTVLKGRMIVDGDEIEIADLKIIGAGMTKGGGEALIAPASAGNPIIVMHGHLNAVENVEIAVPPPHSHLVGSSEPTPAPSSGPQHPKLKGKKHAKAMEEAMKKSMDIEGGFSAIMAVGNENRITNVTTTAPSISVIGDTNKLECIQFYSTHEGVSLQGENNILNDLIFFPSPDPCPGSAVTVLEGNRNLISHVLFVQTFPENTTTLMLKLDSKSAGTKVRYCSSGPVEISGHHQELIGITLHPRFKFTVDGQKHQLVDCAAEQFEYTGKGITITNCEFY